MTRKRIGIGGVPGILNKTATGTVTVAQILWYFILVVAVATDAIKIEQ